MVRLTGGLADTVREFDVNTGKGNGFVFKDGEEEYYHAVLRAMTIFRNKELWSKIINNARSEDRSWTKPTMSYLELYRQAIKAKIRYTSSSPISNDQRQRYAYLRDNYFAGDKEKLNIALFWWQHEYKMMLGQDIALTELVDKEYFLITDENGNYLKDRTGDHIIRPRDLCHKDGTWHRALAVLLLDKEGKLLVQIRSDKKRFFSGCRDSSASGHLGLAKEYIDSVDNLLQHVAVSKL